MSIFGSIFEVKREVVANSVESSTPPFPSSAVHVLWTIPGQRVALLNPIRVIRCENARQGRADARNEIKEALVNRVFILLKITAVTPRT